MTVLFPIKSILIFLFKQRHTRNISNQESNKEGSVESYPTPLNTTCDEPNTPPENRLTKVVGVACVSPQSPIDKLAFFGSFVGKMHFELVITDYFEDEAEEPDSESGPSCPAHRVVRCVNHNE